MRILLLTQIVPFPPDSGPKVKTYHVLRYLAQRHDVHLVSFVRSAEEEARARELEPLCRAGVTTVPLRRSRAGDAFFLLKSLASGRPFLIERDDVSAMRAAVRRVLNGQQFDAAHADQLTMGQFIRDLPVGLRVLDEHNAVWTIVRRAARTETRGPKRLLAELEWRKLRAYEGSLCADVDRVTVVSEDDRVALEQAAGRCLQTMTIPIAIDTHSQPYRPRTADARHILSVATMFYPPNVEAVYWFATQVLPLVRSRMPETQFLIVGSRPPRRIRALAEDPSSGVVVTGYVPDLDPILSQSRVLVVPVASGSGMRVKILEGFARGLPIVSTTIGVEGIEARAGEHLLVADEAPAFAEAVARLLEEPSLARGLAEAGRRLVESRYDWRTALAGLDALYPSAA